MAIQSLFGTSPEEIILARQREARQEQLLRNQQIAQQGAGFGPFRELYQAGLRFGDVASQAAMQRMFPSSADPMLKKATDIQSILTQYKDQDLTNSSVLSNIAKELAAQGYSNEAVSVAQQAAARRKEELDVGFREQQLDISRRGVEVQEGQLGVTKDRFKIDMDNLARQNKLTDAQIKEIDARIANLAADKFNFTPLKDALGNVTGVLAINKSNPSDIKTITISGTTPAAPGAATDPAAAARAELERRNKASGRQPRSSTASPELPEGVSP
jgi:hypothetical protein